jgi:hypothetical protein
MDADELAEGLRLLRLKRLPREQVEPPHIAPLPNWEDYAKLYASCAGEAPTVSPLIPGSGRLDFYWEAMRAIDVMAGGQLPRDENEKDKVRQLCDFQRQAGLLDEQRAVLVERSLRSEAGQQALMDGAAAEEAAMVHLRQLAQRLPAHLRRRLDPGDGLDGEIAAELDRRAADPRWAQAS